MPKMKLDAVTVTSSDFATAVKFYSLLGYTFPDFGADDKHLEAITAAGDVRLMIDDAKFMESMTGKPPVPPTHSAFAIKCETPADVDEAVAAIHKAGFTVIKHPWDAFWSQRYAIVVDPDGYATDVFAWLPKNA